ncbi:MAG: 50S ribosomal protein L15 [Bdellovibrionales bacterium GWB1_55_8]|nr:MAG: 50S ribosomal protein L15 [Bdellovibrionales bacterium GWB1_55_8]
MKLNTIRAHKGATHKRKRLGRGSGSGHGPTAGKGDKGQLQRSGGSVRPGFEGGQMPLYRRIPKRGFHNFARRTNAILNVFELEKFDATQLKEVSLETLVSGNLIKGRYDRLTILGTGELTKAFKVKAHRVSPSAQEKITKAGGSFEILPIPGKKPVKAAAQK